MRITRTAPFRDYQKSVGNATYFINSTIIGLELLALGGKKPPELNIAWQEPKNRRQMVDQARSFVLVSIINLAFDAFDVYLRQLPDVPWAHIPDGTADILKKAVTKKGGAAYSLIERAESILELFDCDAGELPQMLALLAKWRNIFIHSTDPEPSLDSQTQQRLLDAESLISAKYAHTSVATMLKNFWKGNPPTLKEATTLVSASQNLARKIDTTLIMARAGTEKGVTEAAKISLRLSLLGENKTKLRSLASKSDSVSRARKLRAFLEESGFTTGAAGISHPLDPSFLDHLAGLRIEELTSYLSQ